MEKVNNQALLHVAHLTIPSIQVIVVNGNLGCKYCRQRVSQVVGRISGLTDYTVDFRNKQVVARGDVKLHNAARQQRRKKTKKQHPLLKFFSITT